MFDSGTRMCGGSWVEKLSFSFLELRGDLFFIGFYWENLTLVEWKKHTWAINEGQILEVNSRLILTLDLSLKKFFKNCLVCF